MIWFFFLFPFFFPFFLFLLKYLTLRFKSQNSLSRSQRLHPNLQKIIFESPQTRISPNLQWVCNRASPLLLNYMNHHLLSFHQSDSQIVRFKLIKRMADSPILTGLSRTPNLLEERLQLRIQEGTQQKNRKNRRCFFLFTLRTITLMYIRKWSDRLEFSSPSFIKTVDQSRHVLYINE